MPDGIEAFLTRWRGGERIGAMTVAAMLAGVTSCYSGGC